MNGKIKHVPDHELQNIINLADVCSVPAPSENIVPWLQSVGNLHRVLPQGGGALQVLSNRSPGAAFGEGAVPQVHLVEPLPFLLNSLSMSPIESNIKMLVHRLDHGEVGGELEDIVGEALLSEGGAAPLRQLAQPVGVPSKVASVRGERHVLNAAERPFSGNHLWKIYFDLFSSKGRGSSGSTSSVCHVLTTRRPSRPGVFARGTPIGVSTHYATAT